MLRPHSVSQGNLTSLVCSDFECKHQPLKIGRTCGNRFRLVLRDIVTDERTTDAVLSAVRERGFINYYGAPHTRLFPPHVFIHTSYTSLYTSGLQRFGHTGTRNPAVGRTYLARQ